MNYYVQKEQSCMCYGLSEYLSCPFCFLFRVVVNSKLGQFCLVTCHLKGQPKSYSSKETFVWNQVQRDRFQFRSGCEILDCIGKSHIDDMGCPSRRTTLGSGNRRE